MLNPTNDTYKILNEAFDFFNTHLFDAKLPKCMITMQRKSKAKGFFCPERFETRSTDPEATDSSYIHEIALNPACFKGSTDEDIISTLVHEMAHLWQQEFGKPPRGNYHDTEWADKMEDIGLMASNTGEDGGKRTGNAMSHYIQENGKYADLIKIFFEDHDHLCYQDRPRKEAEKAKAKNKIKYTCPNCGTNAWGKPGLAILCAEDNVAFNKV